MLPDAKDQKGCWGLVGENSGDVLNCYRGVEVSGSETIEGLVGDNLNGHVSYCYSTGLVRGHQRVGGLVGWNNMGDYPGSKGIVIQSFWDTQTSEQVWSDGGTGKTTSKMQTVTTFLEAGWDFVEETANGTEDIWWIVEGQGYPRLWWELIP